MTLGKSLPLSKSQLPLKNEGAGLHGFVRSLWAPLKIWHPRGTWHNAGCISGRQGKPCRWLPAEAGAGGHWCTPGRLLHLASLPYRARGGASWHWLHSVSPRMWWHPQLQLRLPASGSWSVLPVSWFGESSRWGKGPCSLRVASSGVLQDRERRTDGQVGKNSCWVIILVTPSLGVHCALQFRQISGTLAYWVSQMGPIRAGSTACVLQRGNLKFKEGQC